MSDQSPEKRVSSYRAYNFESLLANSIAYEPLQTAIAILDSTGALLYANPAFDRFNQAVRSSIEECHHSRTLLECETFSPWLKSALKEGVTTSRKSTFYYGPRKAVELTICLTPLEDRGEKCGALLTLGEESVEFDRRYLARSQELHRKLKERIEVLERHNYDNQRLVSDLLRNAPVAMVLINERREILHINHAAATLFGIDPSAVRGNTCDLVLPCKTTCGRCRACSKIAETSTLAPMLIPQ